MPPPRYLFRRHNVIREIKKLPVKTFLDIGCGAGELDCLLVDDLKMRGQGIDFSKIAIDMANKLKRYYGLDKQPIFTLSSHGISENTKMADIVICLEVLEHQKDDQKMLRNLIALSNKFIIISVPAKQRLYNHSDKLAGHYRRYEKKPLQQMLEKNGLEILSFISYGYPFTNMTRLVRERVAKRRSLKLTAPKSLEKRSMDSGVDLMGVNRYFTLPLDKITLPFYYISRLFNNSDLAEGYLVVAKKSS